MQKLTEKQEAFAIYMYTPGSESEGNGTRSADNAGYGKKLKGKHKEDYLGKQANWLVRNSKIIARKEQIQAENSRILQYNRDIALKEYGQNLKDLDEIIAEGRKEGKVRSTIYVSAIKAKTEILGKLDAISNLLKQTIVSEDIESPLPEEADKISEERRKSFKVG